jgi:hypothetical protein
VDALPWGTYRALAEKLSEYLPIVLYGTEGIEASRKMQQRSALARGKSSSVTELLKLGGA